MANRGGPLGFGILGGGDERDRVRVKGDPPRVDLDVKGRLVVEHATHILTTGIVVFDRWTRTMKTANALMEVEFHTVTSGNRFEPFGQLDTMRGSVSFPSKHPDFHWWWKSQSLSRPTATFDSEFAAQAFATGFNRDARVAAERFER